MFPSILTLNVDLILEFLGFFAPNGAFLERGLGSKTVLGSTHM